MYLYLLEEKNKGGSGILLGPERMGQRYVDFHLVATPCHHSLKLSVLEEQCDMKGPQLSWPESVLTSDKLCLVPLLLDLQKFSWGFYEFLVRINSVKGLQTFIG